MKNRIFLSLAPASLLIGGAAMAAPIGGYDNWTVSSGVITATCPAGHTCTNLDATGNGILQQRMVDNSDTTVAYFRTIITGEGVTATDAASVSALGFRAEGQIGIDGGGGQNFVNRGIVRGGAVLGNDAVNTMAQISNGVLGAGELDIVVLDQEQGLGATTRSMDWHFLYNSGALELNHYSTGGVAGGATGNEGALTVRRSGVLTVAGTLTLDPSGTPQTLAYVAGGAVTAVWLTQAASGVGSLTNRVLGLQRYTAITNDGKTNVGGTSITQANSDGAGNFVAPFPGVNVELGYGATQWGWNTVLFGSRPQQYFTGTLATGYRAPDAPGTFANTYVIP